MLDFFFLLAVGRVCIYLVQTLPPVQEMKSPFFSKLFQCDLCLGFYAYFALISFFGFSIYEYIPLLSEILTAAVMTTIMHYLSLGWKVKHGTFE
jgi:hypothetical protein